MSEKAIIITIAACIVLFLMYLAVCQIHKDRQWIEVKDAVIKDGYLRGYIKPDDKVKNRKDIKDMTGQEYRITPERAAHMHGVAEYCYRHATDAFYRLDPEEMYLLGYLHDIGYLLSGDGRRHEVDGAELLKKHGYDDWREVAEHGTLLNESDVNDKKLILLIEADLKVDMSDKECGYDERLKGIVERHGKDSRAYELCRKNAEFLRSIGRV